MPHDRFGTELREGDIVTIKARVKSVQIGEEYCNVRLETFYPMHPSDDLFSFILNSHQLEVIEHQ